MVAITIAFQTIERDSPAARKPRNADLITPRPSPSAAPSPSVLPPLTGSFLSAPARPHGFRGLWVVCWESYSYSCSYSAFDVALQLAFGVRSSGVRQPAPRQTVVLSHSPPKPL